MPAPTAADPPEVLRRFAELVALVAERPTAAAEQRKLVRSVVEAAKKAPAALTVGAGGRLMAGDATLDLPLLAARFKGYGIEELGITGKAAVADLLDLARMLATEPAGPEAAAGFAGRTAVLDKQALPLRLRPREAAPEAPAKPEPRPSRPTPRRSSSSVTPPPGMPQVTPPATRSVTPEATARVTVPAPAPLQPEHPSAEEPLGRALPLPTPANPALNAAIAAVVSAEADTGSAKGLGDALDHLVLLTELAFRQGRHDDLIEAMAAIVALEHLALKRDASDERRQLFTQALKRLTVRPMLVRQLAVMRHARAADETARTRLQAVLQRYGAHGADALVDELSAATTPEARATCLAALRELRRTHDALLMLSRSPHLRQVQEAAAILGELRDARSEQILVEMLRHDEPRARRAAVAALGRFASATSLDAIAVLLEDASPLVRLGAVAAIGQRRDPRAVPLLAPVLDREPDTEVLFSAVAAVGTAATTDGVQLLIRIAKGEGAHPQHRNPALRVMACTALVAIRSPTAMAAVQQLRDDRDETVREASMRLVAQAKRRSTASQPAVTGS